SVTRSSLSSMTSSFRSGIAGMVSVTRSGMSQATSTVRSQMSSMISIMRGASSQARAAGANVGAGFRSGLASQTGSIVGTARGIANRVTSTIKSALSIHSPSRVMEDLGSDTGEGYVIGLGNWIRKAYNMANSLANAVTSNDYTMNAALATSASIESSGVSSRLDNLSEEVRNVEAQAPIFEIRNEIVGDKIVTYVNQKNARKENKDSFFK
ncbi:MAG TPA: hypothetical protein VFC79_09595, partial [Tissierellaceae bacterium]|nr:hypothetical protein [Tissierellaceae bacterium]